MEKITLVDIKAARNTIDRYRVGGALDKGALTPIINFFEVAAEDWKASRDNDLSDAVSPLVGPSVSPEMRAAWFANAIELLKSIREGKRAAIELSPADWRQLEVFRLWETIRGNRYPEELAKIHEREKLDARKGELTREEDGKYDKYPELVPH